MTSRKPEPDSKLEEQVAQQYASKGFNVTRHPRKIQLPFDLGSYIPDLVVTKAPDENYVIEVKRSVSQQSIDQYASIADIVNKHPPWRFLIVAGDDVASADEESVDLAPLTKAQLSSYVEIGRQHINLGEYDAAFLMLWIVVESALRQKSLDDSIPIERQNSVSLLKNSYSLGDLTMEHYEDLIKMIGIRNRIVHGFRSGVGSELTARLLEIAESLLAAT